MLAMSRRAVSCLFFLAAFVGCQPASGDLSEKDIADISATIDRWADDFLTNKRDDLANIITDDMVLLPPNSAPQSGRDAAMAFMKAYPTITKFTVTKDDIDGHGDVAYVRGTYSIDVTMPDNSTGHEEGTYLEIHRRQADGTWPYSRLSWHSSQPLPQAPPATVNK